MGDTIIVCSELSCPPGDALLQLSGYELDEELAHELRRRRGTDALAASILLELRDRYKLYLFSPLDDSTIEDLGLGAVADEQEISRLIQRHAKCLLLANGRHAVVKLATE